MTLFLHPNPSPHRSRIWPVFLPFQGCPGRCVYCSQNVQTGKTPDLSVSLEEEWRTMASRLAGAAADKTPPLELAFYGGTFTALPEAWLLQFLQTGVQYKQTGLITRIRCSTRPDAVSTDILDLAQQYGLDMVELGIQSFSDIALESSGRGYTSADAVAACRRVKNAGLALGIQLMPGMPGASPSTLDTDLDQALALSPEAVRLYPCIVLEDTGLEKRWRRGEYRPWTLDVAEQLLARALLRCWRAGVRVLRAGLAASPQLDAAVLAGPYHPALGQMARSRALFTHIRTRMLAHKGSLSRLIAPRSCSGDFWGHRGALRRAYATLGIHPERVTYWDKNYFMIE